LQTQKKFYFQASFDSLQPMIKGFFNTTIFMNNGWIKIHRQLLDWEWYDEPNTFRLFMHLLLKANHKPKNYRGVNINTGEVMTGYNLLAEQTGLTVQKVRTALTNLKATNEITIKTSNKGTVIQIVKYVDYQVATSKTTNEQQTDNKRITTNKNVNKEKKKKVVPDVREFMIYAKSKIPDKDEYKSKRDNLILKYESWVINDWKDGFNKPIINWKSKLLNNLQHIKTKKV